MPHDNHNSPNDESSDWIEIENTDEVEVEELVVRLLEDGPVGSAMSGEFDEPLED